jgi:RND family efflux transporter MFP subunit
MNLSVTLYVIIINIFFKDAPMNSAIIFRRLAPFLILLLSFILAGLLIANKKTPKQSDEPVLLPVVEVISAEIGTITYQVPSFGNVDAKFKTQLVSEVSGRLTYISPQFFQGEMVNKGDVLAKIEPFDYQANLKQAMATLAQAQAALDEEVARGEVARVVFKDFKGGQAPALGLRKPQLKKEKANVQFAKAGVDRAQRNLDRTTITAPFDGIIKIRNVDLGQYVNLGNNLGQLFDTSVAQVRLPITSNDLTRLDLSKPTTVTLSQSNNPSITWNAKVVRNEQFIDSETRMLFLVSQVSDPYGRITPTATPLTFGTFVNASITGKSIDNIITLPRYTVRANQVKVINAQDTIEVRDVTVLHQDEHNSYISHGIIDGERVSVTPLQQAGTGQQVIVNQGNSNATSAGVEQGAK